MARFPLFLVFALASIVAMIAIALAPLKPKPAMAAEARVDQGSLIFDATALSHFHAEKGFAVTPAPGPRGDQSGPRLASKSALAPNAKYSKGARLLFTKETTDALSGKAFRVIMVARGVARSAAQSTALGLVTGGPIDWKRAAITPEFTQVVYDMPASSTPVTGLAFWAAVEGEGHGIEIQSIALQPLTTPAGTP